MHQTSNVLATRTPRLPGKHNALPPHVTPLLSEMHRWDGSQIYGSSEAKTTELRDQHEDGKLLLETRGAEESFLPRDNEGNPKTGFSDNW